VWPSRHRLLTLAALAAVVGYTGRRGCCAMSCSSGRIGVAGRRCDAPTTTRVALSETRNAQRLRIVSHDPNPFGVSL
jgi:hypothetical protein